MTLRLRGPFACSEIAFGKITQDLFAAVNASQSGDRRRVFAKSDPPRLAAAIVSDEELARELNCLAEPTMIELAADRLFFEQMGLVLDSSALLRIFDRSATWPTSSNLKREA